jgi:TolB-like protein/DNA-binding winged helix-turn-helix (wHTH) protein/tetratricopeptide (TPR) repeat protein
VSLPAHTVRFGPFQLDLRAAELQHHGCRTRLPEQPFQVLTALLEHPGEVVTREELRQRLWHSDTYVDFEQGLNTAVKRLREALGDSAEKPQYIETVPRHGYRLMVPVERAEPVAFAVAEAPVRRRKLWLTVSALLLLAAVTGVVWRQRLLERLRPVKIESLAVLPLENLSGSPEEEYFADGMTEALITELGKVHALRVISRQSVMQYKGTNKAVPQIAHELHVDAVVEGSVLRAGGKVRITTQLIQANPEHHLWSETYERKLSDVIALQRDVTQAIVREIRVSLTPAEQVVLSHAAPVSPEAYEAYLKGYFFLQKLSPEGIRRSFDFFQQAIDKDPGYAPAYVGLAQAYIISGDRNVLPSKEAYAQASPLVMKALALDDTLSDAHGGLAFLREINWDWAGAEQEYLRAIDLDPGNARAHNWYGIFLAEMGRMDAALAENQRARQLNPTGRGINAALTLKLVLLGRYDEALEQAKASVEMDENSAPAHFALGLAYTKKGLAEEAISELQRAVAASEGYSGYEGVLAYSYAVFGRTAEACRVAEHMKQAAARTYVRPSDLAAAYAACGRNEEALRWLDRAYREHDSYLAGMKTDITLERLRSDPRFRELVLRMHFPE